MHLLAISLLSILAGTLLLAKVRKELPGKLFAFISWFFIVVGFLLFLAFVAGGICRLSCHGWCGEKAGCQQEMMMKKCGPGMQGMQGKCCNPGMPGSLDKSCGPGGMERGMCGPKPECMKHDSLMKCCPKHMAGDTAKAEVKKK